MRINLSKFEADLADSAQVQQIFDQLPHAGRRTLDAVDGVVGLFHASSFEIVAKRPCKSKASHNRAFEVMRNRIEELFHFLVLGREFRGALFNDAFKLSVYLPQL